MSIWAYSVEKLDRLPDGTSKLERCSKFPPKKSLFAAYACMERTLFSDFSMLCPSLEFFNRMGSKLLFAAGAVRTAFEIGRNMKAIVAKLKRYSVVR